MPASGQTRDKRSIAATPEQLRSVLFIVGKYDPFHEFIIFTGICGKQEDNVEVKLGNII